MGRPEPRATRSAPAHRHVLRATPPASRPPKLPPVGNIEGSGNVASECPDSDQGGSGDVEAFVDDFLALLPTHVARVAKVDYSTKSALRTTRTIAPPSTGIFLTMVTWKHPQGGGRL